MAKFADPEIKEPDSQNETILPKNSQTKANLREILTKLHHGDSSQASELKELYSQFQEKNPDHPMLKTISNRMHSMQSVESSSKIQNSSLKLSRKSTITPSERNIKEIASSIKQALQEDSPNHDNIIKLINHLRDYGDIREFNINFETSFVKNFENSGASSQQIAEFKKAISKLSLTGHLAAAVRG